MLYALQEEFDENFKDIFKNILSKRKEEQTNNTPIYTDKIPDALEAFSKGILKNELILSEKDLNIDRLEYSITKEGIPYIKYYVKVKAFNISFNMIAYHNSSWEYYLLDQ